MIQIDPRNLIDNAAIEAAQARLDDAVNKLEAAKAAVQSASADVSAKWDASVAAVAAGSDALEGAEAHGAAVQRRDFAVQMVAVAETNLAEAREKFEKAKTLAHIPVLRKGRELRLAAAQAHDASKRAADAADALAAQGARLMGVAHAAGLRHFNMIDMPRRAVSETEESVFLEHEATRAKNFWGADL